MGKDGFHWFVGVVEDRNDPEKVGRVRVRCLGLHTGDIEKISPDTLPWASVMMPVTAGGNSGVGVSSHFLVEGTWVVGFFRDAHLQEPVIMGTLPGVNTVDATATSTSVKGFKDQGVERKPPSGPDITYPTSKYTDKPDTNLLAQELVSSHESNSIKTASESWSTASGSASQPASKQSGAKYPYNHVLETESGHYIEFDDTKGNERIHIFHKKGTFIEIDPTGNVVIKTVGNVTNIVAGNMDTYVKGNYTVSAVGNIDLYAKGNLTEKVDGNRKTTITGEETLEITGPVKNTFKATLTEEVTGAVTQTYDAMLTTKISMTADITAGGVANIKSDVAMIIGGSSISFN